PSQLTINTKAETSDTLSSHLSKLSLREKFSSMASNDETTTQQMPPMPPTQQAPAQGAVEYWTLYMRYERAKSVTSPKYQLEHSLRIWFMDYERQAGVQGVLNLDDCPEHVSKSMPPVIQNWIPTLPVETRTLWSSFKDSLLRRFGKPAFDENKTLYKALIDLKQHPNQPISIHAANWEHQLSLLAETLDANQQAIIFVQSLAQRDFRMALLNWVDDKTPESVDLVIQKTMHMETQAQIMRDLQLASSAPASTAPYDPNAMEVDYVNSKQLPSTQKPPKSSHPNKQPSSDSQLKYAYDKNGNPICDHCRQKHRTKDCTQHQQLQPTSPNNNNNKGPKRGRRRHSSKNKNNNKPDSVASIDASEKQAGNGSKDNVTVNTLDTSPLPSISCFTDLYTSNCIQHVNNAGPSQRTPICTITIRNQQCDALVDTGADISLINEDLANQLKLDINTQRRVSYMDVNQNVQSTVGSVTLTLLDAPVTLHVIRKMKHKIIFGWDTLSTLNGIIDTSSNCITLRNNNQHMILRFASTPMVHTLDTLQYQDALKQVVQKHSSIIPENTKRPSVTHLLHFSFDLLPELKPIFIPPRRLHPTLQQLLDKELEDLCQLGICTKVNFSDWACAAALVPKPDGSYRLTKLPSLFAFTLPTCKTPLPLLVPAAYSPNSTWPTTLSARSGLYQFNVMPFGLVNAPAFFQQLMMTTLGALLWSCCIAYMVDIILYSQSFQEHLVHLDLVMSTLKAATLSHKLSKCQFARPSGQHTKTSTRKAICPMSHTAGAFPWQRVAMDFLGPLPPSTLGFKYVLFDMDTFSRYAELFPVASTSQTHLANLLYHTLIPRHELSEEFLSDNGPPSTSALVTTLAQLLQVDLRYSPPYQDSISSNIRRNGSDHQQMSLQCAHLSNQGILPTIRLIPPSKIMLFPFRFLTQISSNSSLSLFFLLSLPVSL
ncbi:hypothetical protein, partial, partial [Absidia glauca]